MILRSLWVLTKSFLVVLSLYSFLWYITGQYVKINLKSILNSCFNYRAEVTADSISFSGYPFNFIYTAKNLEISYPLTMDNGVDLKFHTITFTSNVLIDSIKIDLDDPMDFSTRNNKFNYSIKWDEGARINFKFTKPLLLDVLSHASPSFSFNYFAYFDSGYNIFDKSLDKIVFISASNKVRMEIMDEEDSTQYTLQAAMDGEGGVDSHKDAQGEHSLVADLLYNVCKTSENKNFELQVNKFSVNTEKYEFSAVGSLGTSEEINASKLDIEIKNRTNLLNTIESILSPQLALALKQVIPELPLTKKDKLAADNVSFSISPTSESYNIIKTMLRR